MKVLVINAGSSSLKFQLIDMENKEVIAKGNVEKINEKGSFLKYKAKGQEYKFEKDITNHSEGMELVLNKLTDEKIGVVASLDEIEAFGHRVVNVGEKYFDSTLVTPEVLEDFRMNVDFSPLHVPGAIAGIKISVPVSFGNVNKFAPSISYSLGSKLYVLPLFSIEILIVVKLAGRVSVTITLVASIVPVLVRVI